MEGYNMIIVLPCTSVHDFFFFFASQLRLSFLHTWAFLHGTAIYSRSEVRENHVVQKIK